MTLAFFVSFPQYGGFFVLFVFFVSFVYGLSLDVVTAEDLPKEARFQSQEVEYGLGTNAVVG